MAKLQCAATQLTEPCVSEGEEDVTVRGWMRAFALLLLVASPFFSQEPAKEPTKPVAETPKPTPPPASPSEEAFKKVRALRTDAPAYVEALVKFLIEFPRSRESDSGAYMLRDAVEKDPGNDPQKTRALVGKFVEGTGTLPEQMRLRFYSMAVDDSACQRSCSGS